MPVGFGSEGLGTGIVRGGSLPSEDGLPEGLTLAPMSVLAKNNKTTLKPIK